MGTPLFTVVATGLSSNCRQSAPADEHVFDQLYESWGPGRPQPGNLRSSPAHHLDDVDHTLPFTSASYKEMITSSGLALRVRALWSTLLQRIGGRI